MLDVVLRFDDGHEVRYSDQRRMVRWYLVPGDGLDQVPQMPTLGPDAMAITKDDFLARLKPRRGQIKATLTNQEFVAGGACTPRCAPPSKSRSRSWMRRCRARSWAKRKSGGST